MAILQGYLIGLAMIVFIGPVFFYLMETTVNKGTKMGFAAAFGIFFSDVLAALLCYAGLSAFLEGDVTQVVFSGLGGAILLVIGIGYLTKRYKRPKVDLGATDLAGAFSKGFLVNFINPFVFLVWIAIVAYAKDAYTSDATIRWHLFAATLGVITTDSLKVLLARKIRPLLRPRIMVWLYRAMGILMIAFSLRLLYHGINLLVN